MRQLYLFVLTLFIGFNTYSQTSEWEFVSVNSADIERFIKNFPQIEKDFEGVDLDDSSEKNLEAFLNGIKVNNEADRILKKYGYSDVYDFAVKAWTISMGYASLKMESEGMPAFEQAVAEINSNEDMTSEQKEMALQQLELMKEAITSAMPGLENEELINTIRPYEADLEKVFE